MKKLILASASGIALLGLAACSDTDGTTTQALPEDAPMTQEAPGMQPDPIQPAPPPAAPVD